ncbi:MAG: hypothetical protein IJ292_01230 [Clostridia bacterium]|nr:hypothetical protein [Clostridia bacterium]
MIKLQSCHFKLQAHNGVTILHPNTKVLDFQGLFVFLGGKKQPPFTIAPFLEPFGLEPETYKNILNLYNFCGIMKIKKGGVLLKKDLFNGKIKREYVSYIWTTIIIVALVFFGCGGLFLYISLLGNTNSNTSLLLLVFGIVSYLFGAWYSFGTFFFIRQYPKHKKMIKLFLNSDCYFVDSTSNEYFGENRTIRGHMNKAAFNLVTYTAEQNKDLEHIRYPKIYGAFISLTIIGIFLIFFNIFIVWLALENMNVLPLAFRSEDVIFTVFIVVEVVDVILSFVFAFRVKKIREKTIDEYRAAQRKNNGSSKQK